MTSPKQRNFYDYAGAASVLTPPELVDPNRPVVCVQGLGFVGFAMATAVANALDANGRPRYNVIGVDLPSDEGQRKVDSINAGRPPMAISDVQLSSALEAAHRRGNLVASTDPEVFRLARIALVDVHLDVDMSAAEPRVDFSGFKRAIRTLGERLPAGSLIIVETTVPPGTCANVVRPELDAALLERKLPGESILLAHSYERVMPGKDYYRSITEFWRVFAGETEAAAEACAAFLSHVIATDRFPLTRLKSVTASETAKVLENSYRAANIAFMEEWGRFAEAAGIDIFEVVDAIRVRPTHSNIRQPGFGVGGYCLTKDPLFPVVAAREFFTGAALEFPFSRQAVEVNRRMPHVTVDKLAQALGGLKGKKVLLAGVSYRQDVGDTRYSPSEVFVKAVWEHGGEVVCHDPLVAHWAELNLAVQTEFPPADGFDAVVFAVPHEAYRTLDLGAWAGNRAMVIVDANQVLTKAQWKAVASLPHVRLAGIGRGDLPQ